MAKGLLDLDKASEISDADLLLVNQGGVDKSTSLGAVKGEVLKMVGVAEGTLAAGNHSHGGDVTPDADDSRSIGSADLRFKDTFSRAITTESLALKGLSAGRATVSFNEAENSIDFSID